MASLTQQPQLYPSPNLEPPGFDLIRQLLMSKWFGQEASPYGLATGANGQAVQPSPSMYAGNGRGTFNPYSGGYSGGPSQQPPMGQGGGWGAGVGSAMGGQQMQQGPMMPGGMQGGGMGGGQGAGLAQMLQQMQGAQQQMPPQQQPPQQGQGGGGMYGFDGYTLNNQITHLGDDACMGHDMPGAPPMQMQGPQPGGMMPPRPPMHRPPMGGGGVDPRKLAAVHAIMAAMAAKRRMGGGQPPQRPPMMGAPPMGGPPPMGPRPMGMDAPMRQPNSGPMPPVGNSNPGAWGPPSGNSNPGAWNPPPSSNPGAWNPNPSAPAGGFQNVAPQPGGSGATGWSMPNPNATQYGMENQWNQGWGPRMGGASGAAPTENPSGNTWSQPQNYSTYDMENWFSGGAHPVSQPTGANAQATPAAASTPMGHDSPYMFQRGPMAPLGMDGATQPFAGPGLPGPIASNFGGGGGDPAAMAAIAAILGGGGGTGIGGGGMDFRQKRPMGFDGFKPPKPQSEAKFVVAGRGGRPHRVFDEPRVI